MKIKENLWEAIETLGKYTDRHVLSMSRADYEAHLLAIRALNDYQFRKDLDAMGPQAEAEKAEEERLSALERQALVTEDEKREARRREESETALDEYETARLWAMSPPRYCVTLIVDEVAGLPNVEVHLFHESMPNDEMASLVVLAPDRDIEHVAKWYTGTAIEQTFSKAEVQQLHSYLKEFPTSGV